LPEASDKGQLRALLGASRTFLIGAAKITRPYGEPIAKAVWEPPVWVELKPKNQTVQCFEYLLSLPDHFPGKPLFLMFSAGYDWSMWLQDIPFGKAFEVARQRGFAPPCRRMRGMVFGKNTLSRLRPYFDFKLSELRWPDDPYGEKHTDDPAYKKPGKGQKAKLQVSRRITIVDTFRFSPKSFVETIKPLAERGLIPKDVFDTTSAKKKNVAVSIWRKWRTSRHTAGMSCTRFAASCI